MSCHTCEQLVGVTMLSMVDTLSYRFSGVIILSAVLKRRMILADKAKSMFISKYTSSFLS